MGQNPIEHALKKTGYALLFFVILISNAYSWNALGHRLVAQVAYHHMTKNAKRVFNYYNQALDTRYRSQNLINSAAWLDWVHDDKEPWLRQVHYIDLPFSPDGTALKPPHKINAITAIERAKAVMQSHEDKMSKGLNTRILIHVIGDLHQPLHAANQFSAEFPGGDKGGNLVYLGKNSIAKNLHAYWDRGGGFLTKSKHYSKAQLNKKAYRLEKKWPCHVNEMNLDPNVWAEESHQLAIKEAYQIKAGQKPDANYQHRVNLLTQQRLALAGCRLAAVLNKLA